MGTAIFPLLVAIVVGQGRVGMWGVATSVAGASSDFPVFCCMRCWLPGSRERFSANIAGIPKVRGDRCAARDFGFGTKRPRVL